jgi:hypothetical protein
MASANAAQEAIGETPHIKVRQFPPGAQVPFSMNGYPVGAGLPRPTSITPPHIAQPVHGAAVSGATMVSALAWDVS